MTTLEARLKAIETALAMGMIGGGSDLQDQLNRQNLLLAGLRTEKVIGNVLGGMIRTEIAPGALPIGPYRQDVDATYALQFNLWVPDYFLRIKRAQIRIAPGTIRSSVSVAASSGQLTSDSGGGSTSGGTASSSGGGSTAGAESSHTHGVTPQTTTVPVPSASGVENSLYTGNETAAGDPHQHGLGSHTHGLSSHTHGAGGQVTSTGGASHQHSTPDHTHPAHTHTTPAHQHTVPGHTHSLTLAIAEGGSAAGLNLWIDGVNRTTALGGPWDAAALLDITQYLVDARLIPVAGAHAIKVTSTTVGSVEAVGDLYGVIKAIV